jgi:predicted nucleotide-binding protein
MQSYEELHALAKTLSAAATLGDADNVSGPLKKLGNALKTVEKSFSGSWLGYHSRVYYAGLATPPPGANFSQEWGLKDLSLTSLGSRGDWREYDGDLIKQTIHAMAGDPSLENAQIASGEARTTFDRAKPEAISILETEIAETPDPFLKKLINELEKLEPMSSSRIQQSWLPRGQYFTRDSLALSQGNKVPPHVEIGAEVAAHQQTFAICKSAADICAQAASHIERKSRKAIRASRIGTNVFIGHGRSKMWRELKDFVQDRLGLPWDEFNRVPVAGVTNIARLSEMLDAAAIALLVMTGEDELADGGLQARMNVVHEAGLFQGRLGFTRAIVLLEEGCSEFSNIQGLGQIRFPKGNIAAAFEEVRRVLEREELID